MADIPLELGTPDSPGPLAGAATGQKKPDHVASRECRRHNARLDFGNLRAMTNDGMTVDTELPPATEAMRILLADDHDLVRDGIRALLETRLPAIEVVTAADLGAALTAAAAPPGFDLVLLDLRMPGMDGTVGVERMRAVLPQVPVAILSGYPCPPELATALARLHINFLPKTLSGEALLTVLTEVLGRDEAPSLAAPGSADTAPDEARPLTRRERQVLAHLSLGLSNKEIARRLNIEEVTVRLHLRGVFRKLGVRNRTQAVRHAIDYGLDIGTP